MISLLSKLVSLRAKRSPAKAGLRHFVPRNDTLLVSQKYFSDDSNCFNLDILVSLITAFFLCFLAAFRVSNSFAQDGVSGNAAGTQDNSSLRPAVEFNARGLRDPFKDYVTPEEVVIGEEIENQESREPEVFNPSALKIQGIIWGGIKPCVIINGEVKKENENIEGATILKIEKEGLELLYDGKKYNLPSVSSALMAE